MSLGAPFSQLDPYAAGHSLTRDVTLIRSYLENYDYDSGTSTVALGPQP